jgi:hypothetical protein
LDRVAGTKGMALQQRAGAAQHFFRHRHNEEVSPVPFEGARRSSVLRCFEGSLSKLSMERRADLRKGKDGRRQRFSGAKQLLDSLRRRSPGSIT